MTIPDLRPTGDRALMVGIIQDSANKDVHHKQLLLLFRVLGENLEGMDVDKVVVYSKLSNGMTIERMDARKASVIDFSAGRIDEQGVMATETPNILYVVVTATWTPRPPTVIPQSGQTQFTCPSNCATAQAMGLTDRQAAACPGLDGDHDGVACYGD